MLKLQEQTPIGNVDMLNAMGEFLLAREKQLRSRSMWIPGGKHKLHLRHVALLRIPLSPGMVCVQSRQFMGDLCDGPT